MNHRWIAAIAATVAVLFTAGCGHDNLKDLKGVVNHKPDAIENIENMDGHPNIGVLCIHGVAFVTTTRDFKAVERETDLDKWCPPPVDRKIGQR